MEFIVKFQLGAGYGQNTRAMAHKGRFYNVYYICHG